MDVGLMKPSWLDAGRVLRLLLAEAALLRACRRHHRGALGISFIGLGKAVFGVAARHG